ncbi:MAG TPA: hypothetical protein VMV82_02360 [Candidatus Dormibacteraeota bacterium]|nr:hypothetical protein [Candidatus Dormibacteraeota bacterium]
MGQVVALGEAVRVAGFALAGAGVVVADGPAAVRDAWRALPGDVVVVVLTPAAAASLGGAVEDRGEVLTVVMPG